MQRELTKDRPTPRNGHGHGHGHGQIIAVGLIAQAVSWSVAFLVVGPIVLPDRSTNAEIALTIGLAVSGWIIGWWNGLYTDQIGRERTSATLRTLRSLVVQTMFAAVCGVAFNLAAKELAVGIGLIWTLTVFGRAFVHARIRVHRSSGHHHDRILVVGANHEAAHFVELLELYPELGLDPVGVVGNAAEASINGLDALFCGPLLSAGTRSQELDTRFAVIMTGAIPSGRLRSVIDHLQDSGVELMLSTDLGPVHQRRLQTRSIGFAPVFLVDDGSHRDMALRIKRSADVAISLVALVLTAPVQLLAAVAVRVTNRGPAYYRQRRLGIDGTVIEVLRFRTMKTSDAVQSPRDRKQAVWSDDRMTWIGRLLEVTAVNEIPQFWNVLRGEMSLVGPKPGYPALDGDAQNLSMVPGLTGLWRTEANLYPTSDVRHELDDLYAQNWSLRLDVGVVVASIELIMVRLIRGASWRHAHGGLPIPETSAVQPQSLTNSAVA